MSTAEVKDQEKIVIDPQWLTTFGKVLRNIIFVRQAISLSLNLVLVPLDFVWKFFLSWIGMMIGMVTSGLFSWAGMKIMLNISQSMRIYAVSQRGVLIIQQKHLAERQGYYWDAISSFWPAWYLKTGRWLTLAKIDLLIRTSLVFDKTPHPEPTSTGTPVEDAKKNIDATMAVAGLGNYGTVKTNNNLEDTPKTSDPVEPVTS